MRTRFLELESPAKIAGVAEKQIRLLGVRIGTEWQCAMSVYREPVNAHFWSRWSQLLEVFGFGSQLQLLYIDYLETAPWNYEPFVRPNFPRFRGAGGILMEEAVRLSVEMGLKGRVGLFSLSGAERFYERLGMTRLFKDTNPPSPTRGLWYYELSPKKAQVLLARRNATG